MQTKKTRRPKGLIRRFIPYFAKYKAVLFFDLFCAALTTVCELVLPMLVRYVTNAGINDLASLTVGVVLKIGALYLFLRLVDAAANFFMASVGPHHGHQNRDRHAHRYVRPPAKAVL